MVNATDSYSFFPRSADEDVDSIGITTHPLLEFGAAGALALTAVAVLYCLWVCRYKNIKQRFDSEAPEAPFINTGSGETRQLSAETLRRQSSALSAVL